MKPKVTLYLDHEVKDEIDGLQSDKDWEEFFSDYEIEAEIRRTPMTYIFH